MTVWDRSSPGRIMLDDSPRGVDTVALFARGRCNRRGTRVLRTPTRRRDASRGAHLEVSWKR